MKSRERANTHENSENILQNEAERSERRKKIRGAFREAAYEVLETAG